MLSVLPRDQEVSVGTNDDRIGPMDPDIPDHGPPETLAIEMAPRHTIEAPPGDPTRTEPPATSPPTNISAYKPRGIRSTKLNALSIANVTLRAFSAVFALISFSVIASNREKILINFSLGITLKFNDFFYLSYLLTVNVLAFVYALFTMGLFMYFLTSGKAFNFWIILCVFALDEILSDLLMSASTSAATGIRAQRAIITGEALDSFESQAYAGVAMSFLAFFLLAAVKFVSGYLLIQTRRARI